jgi:hypothetical protein
MLKYAQISQNAIGVVEETAQSSGVAHLKWGESRAQIGTREIRTRGVLRGRSIREEEYSSCSKKARRDERTWQERLREPEVVARGGG